MSKERVAGLRKRVKQDPYDAQAWELLVSEADRARRGSERNNGLTAVYEDLLKVFPTAAGYWREYADHQMSCSDEGVVKGVFSRCLLTCLSVDLWRSYLNFIKRLNDAAGPRGLPEVRQAYEFTLDRLGQDSACGGIWLDYISFLQAPKQGSPEYEAVYGEALEGQEESQKVSAVRRAYQRALLVPTGQLDGLWRGYEGFEMSGSNKQLARRLLDEWRPQYQAARSLLRERESRLAGINLKALALPPGRGGNTQQQQAALWREYLAWERGNPQRLDAATYSARVALAFEQALMVLFHYPDVWLEFAGWHQQGGGGGGGAAAAVLEKGRRALPAALALHFAAADLQESLGNPGAAKAVYEELVEQLKPAEEAAPAAAPTAGNGANGAAGAGTQQAAAAEPPPPPLQQQQQGGDEAAKAEAPAEQQPKQEEGGEAPPPPPPPPAAAPLQQQAEAKPEPAAVAKPGDGAQAAEGQAAEGAGATAASGIQLDGEQGTLAWVQYMRYARRAEGIMAARKLFMRARKWPGIRWQAYTASALLEWRHEPKDTIPRNIFELGLKSHLGEAGLVLAYSQFLLGLGDIPNTRALFERALTAAAPEPARQLWDAYLAFEYDVGSLAAAAAVEQRRGEAAAAAREAAAAAAAGALLDAKQEAAVAPPGPGHDALRLALLKYRVQDLWPASAVQRTYMERLLGTTPAPESGGAEPRPREREGDGRRERDRDRGERDRSDRDRSDRDRRDRRRSTTPPRRGGGHVPRSPARDVEPLRLSRELAQLMNQLPPTHALEGPVPDVERVVQVILAADLSPDGIIAHEVAAAHERRRQRRLAEQGPSGLVGPGGPASGAPGAGQKRKPDFDSGSDSDEEYRGREAGGAPAAAAPAAADGGYGGGGGLDVYRMRRKQQRV